MLTKYINCENQSDPKHVYCILDFYMSFDAIRVPFSLSTNCLWCMSVFLYISFLIKSTSTRTRDMYSILFKRFNFNLNCRKSNYPREEWNTAEDYSQWRQKSLKFIIICAILYGWQLYKFLWLFYSMAINAEKRNGGFSGILHSTVLSVLISEAFSSKFSKQKFTVT